MQVTVPTREHRRILRRGSRPASWGKAAPVPSTAVRTVAEAPVQEARERASGGPEDVARYECSCGYVFRAEVSASVGCPQCGCAQAW
jgi:hypothetical protein